ncbi:hypothetical protein ES702_05091 [subsurface metagenome]
MAEIYRWIRHNQGLFVALLISAALLVWTFGCESMVGSLTEPGRMVNRDELQAEISAETKRLEAELDALLQMATVKMQKLDREDEIKRKLFEFASITAQTGTVNPAGVLTLVGSFIGAGALVDNRIKDKVIKNRPLAES